MKDIDDLFEDSEPEVWVNFSDKPDFRKYKDLIEMLESLEKEYLMEDFNWLKSENRTMNFGFENHQFHYFVYCIDWSELYGVTDSKLTIYDILIKNNSVNKKEAKFKEAYSQIRRLFNGEISSSSDLIKCRDVILERISNGLSLFQPLNGFKPRGLNEFFRMLFDKIGNVDYEQENFKEPYLTGDFQSGRFIIDLFDKVIPAFEVSKKFNKDFKGLIPGVTIDNFFAFHVLLRHTVTFKIQYFYSPNPEAVNIIKTGLNKSQKITAHVDSEGAASVISQDGEFYPPNFTCKQDDYIKFKSNGGTLSINDIAEKLYDKLKNIVPVFIEKFKPNFSPNIIFFENELYGFEFPTWAFRNENLIKLSSFYPLNSEYQIKNGISQTDIDKITNIDSVPDEFMENIKKK